LFTIQHVSRPGTNGRGALIPDGSSLVAWIVTGRWGWRADSASARPQPYPGIYRIALLNFECVATTLIAAISLQGGCGSRSCGAVGLITWPASCSLGLAGIGVFRLVLWGSLGHASYGEQIIIYPPNLGQEFR